MSTLIEKVAFVAGGTQGMGQAIVEHLAAEGAAVAFTYMKSDEIAVMFVEIRHTVEGSHFSLLKSNYTLHCVCNTSKNWISCLSININLFY